MQNVVPFHRPDPMLNPQFQRVQEMDNRIKVAGVLTRHTETHHAATQLLHGIRHDIIADKPHRLRNDAPFIQRAFSAHLHPTMVAKDWRKEINAQFAAMKIVSDRPSTGIESAVKAKQ
jgi:hypothetical protein